MEYLRAFYTKHGETTVWKYVGDNSGGRLSPVPTSFKVFHNREKPVYEPIEFVASASKKIQGTHSQFYEDL